MTVQLPARSQSQPANGAGANIPKTCIATISPMAALVVPRRSRVTGAVVITATIAAFAVASTRYARTRPRTAVTGVVSRAGRSMDRVAAVAGPVSMTAAVGKATAATR